MVVAQIPLWIQHASDSTQTTSASTATFPLKNSKANPWTNTRRSAIYAIDIAGPRIATGGGDGMVRIWSINALFTTTKSVTDQEKMAHYSSKGYSSSEASDADADTNSVSSNEKPSTTDGAKKRKRNDLEEDQGGNTRLLCKMSSHSGSVLSLRFSTSHTILASAGDDSHVILYTQSAAGNLAHSGNLIDTSDNVENWSRVRICRGHNLDVVGLAWAPDDSHLISCSLDSDAPICVWRMDFDKHGHAPNGSNTIMQPYKILGVKEHTSTVKGVAFDPAGKYVASSGDDPSLCIWRAFDDWGLESRVDSSSGIFQQDVQSLANLSMFRRISFAPD
jgi:protein HIRA/HIR1